MDAPSFPPSPPSLPTPFPMASSDGFPSPATNLPPPSSSSPFPSQASSAVARRSGPMGVYEMVMTRQPLSSRLYSPEAAMHRPVLSRGDEDPNSLSVDSIARRSLPFAVPYGLTATPRPLPPDFSWVSSSCGGKAAIGVVGGGVMGLLMGVFLGAMSDATPPITVIGGKDVPQAPFREQMRVVLRATGEKSLYWCRNFAFITGVFGGSECLVEKYRGKHDVWNSVASGCITGAALQAKSGPQAAAVGCGGFAAFSFVIDSVMGH